METNNVPNRIHPLVAVAAVSVTLVSLTGIAAITGLLPSSHGTDTPVAPLAAAPAATNTPAIPTTANTLTPTASTVAINDAKTTAAAAEAAESAPAPKKTVHRSPQIAQTHRSQPRTSHSSGSNAVAQADVCHSCGRIESIETIQQQAQPSGLGIAAGAIIGGALGNQIGDGNGRKLATIAGVVGGGYAGNEIEKRTRGTTTYKVRVRMEDGSTRTFPYSAQPGWNEGDRVRVVNGSLVARG